MSTLSNDTHLIYDLSKETIFRSTGRTSMIPMDPKYRYVVKNLDIQQGSIWTHTKIKFGKDRENFPKMKPEFQECTEKVLGYFARSDELIEEIISKSCINKIMIPEIQSIYAFESMMEKVHSRVYNLNIQAVISDPVRQEQLFHAVDHMPFVALKAENAQRYITDTRHPGFTLAGKAGNEGINFSSSFAWIDYLKECKCGLTGTSLANEEISRDEARHVDTSFIVYDLLDHKLTPDNVAEVLDECERVERLFVEDALPKIHMDGMSIAEMHQHVQHAKAIIAAGLGYPELYKGTSSPFKFMKKRSLNFKANFFEEDSADYTKLDASEDVDGFESQYAEF